MAQEGNGQSAPIRAVPAAPRDGNVYAAIDLGTNNCRLLVARPNRNGFRVIDAFSRIVRLGEGLTATGRLSEAAMDRTLAALATCANKMRRRRVTHVRAVATEACRRASNCDEFLERVKRQTGIALEIITNSEEAYLALHGCASLLDRNRPHALIFDIGGGSTQVSWLKVEPAAQQDGVWVPTAAALGDWISIPLGVVTLAEGNGAAVSTLDQYTTMVEEVASALRPFEDRHNLCDHIETRAIQMVGTSGTVTTLAGLHMALPRYERSKVDGCHLDFDTITTLSRALATMSFEERLNQPCIGRDRADLVVAGCAILEAICKTWPVGRLRVGDRGLREGILADLMRASGEASQGRSA